MTEEGDVLRTAGSHLSRAWLARLGASLEEHGGSLATLPGPAAPARRLVWAG